LDGTRKTRGLRHFDRRFDRRHRGNYGGWRQHESNRSDQRALRIMTAGHGAGHHSGHVMPAIHRIGRCRGVFLVVMCGNRALAGCAAGHLIRRPRNSRQRRIEQNNRKQADARGNRTLAIVTRSLHVIQKPLSVVRHYSAERHSLQAQIKNGCTRPLTIRQMLFFFAAGRPIRP
jgi:hypothetical protein